MQLFDSSARGARSMTLIVGALSVVLVPWLLPLYP
jgi:hypothetical protein